MKKTLKTILFVVIMAIVLFCLTGCANVNYEIKLNKDGSGEVSYTMGYDKAFLSSMGVTTEDLSKDSTLDEMKEEAEKEGYTIEKYEDDDTYGFKASKVVTNIQEEFSVENTIGESDNKNDDRILYEKSLLKTKYSQNAKMNLTFDEGSSTQETAMMNTIMGQMKISYKIVLPFKAGENNATTVSEDGKVLTWELKTGKENTIQFVAQEDYTMIALGGLAVILLLVVIIIIVIVRKKGKKTLQKQEKVVAPAQEQETVKEEIETQETTKTEEIEKEIVPENVQEENEDENKQEDNKEDENK